MKKKSGSAKRKRIGTGSKLGAKIVPSVRQLWYYPEFRIPDLSLRKRPSVPPAAVNNSEAPMDSQHEDVKYDRTHTCHMLANIATSLWYLKTKYFKRDWLDEDKEHDDPRVRKALGRLNKGIASFKRIGIELHDPTKERFPEGGEGMMRPLHLKPTAGLTFAIVTITVQPIVYYRDSLIQRGEVFVDVPIDEPRQVLQSNPQVTTTNETASGTVAMEDRPENELGQSTSQRTEAREED